MYCPSCGAEANEALRYCKRCGANLNSPAAPITHGRFPPWLVVFFLFAIGVITIVGLMVPIMSSHDLVADGFNPPGVGAIFLISALVSLGVDWLLVWVLLKMIKAYHGEAAPAPRAINQPATSDRLPAQISAPPESVGSVTEHTTRNFEEYDKVIRARQQGRDTK